MILLSVSIDKYLIHGHNSNYLDIFHNDLANH